MTRLRLVPPRCPVCADRDEVDIQLLTDPPTAPVRAPCLHCGPARLTAIYLPWMADTPRKAS